MPDDNQPTGDTKPPSLTEYHPALRVNNIKNAIPLVLDREKVQYSNWVELFECHAHAFNVLDHIDPKTPKPSDIFETMWKRLDSIVKQWIYGTISYDLLQSFLCRGDTAQQIWKSGTSLKKYFKTIKIQDSYLDNQFTTLHLNNFANINAYCTQLKVLTGQLANVDQPVSKQKLILRLITGLISTDFDTVATIISAL